MASLAETAGWLFGWLLRNSAHATVLAGVVLALERTVGRDLSPRWRYGLWLLVVARLVLPIAPGSSLSLFNLFDFAPSAVAHAVLQVLGLPSPVPVPVLDPPHPLADTPPWFVGALALWFPGALILSALLWRDQQRLQLALTGVPVADGETQDLLTQSKAVMCVRRHVELVETSQITSPAIAGWLRPRMLLPAGLLGRLTRDETRFLFLHELAHVKRGDIALNWILAAVQILHWFNPVVWFALRRLLTVREEVCDDLVLRRCFLGAAREYGLTLIRLLEECAPRRLLPAYAGVLDDARSLRQRVRCIREFRISETNPWMPAALTICVAVAGLTERPDHNALSAPTPSYAEVRAHVRPNAKGTRGKPLRPAHRIPGPTTEALATPPRRPSPSSGLVDTLFAALRRALSENHPGRPATAPETAERPSSTPPPVVLATTRTVVPAANPRASSAPPYPLAVGASQPAVPYATLARQPHPRGPLPASDLEPQVGRAPEVVPYFGRQANLTPVSVRRPAS